MKALIFCNGEGGGFHDPVETSEMFRDGLQAAGVEVELHKTMDCLSDAEHLKKMDLIIPNWTMGRLEGPHEGNLSNAIAGGTGLAGVHGGAGDAFRHSLGYQWMVGGQFVGHPYCDEFEVTLTSAGKRNPITAGMASPFKYKSEQYYMLVDPGNKVLATTVYLGNKAHQQGRGKMKLPMVWTKTWGKGRVFYSALGHAAKEFRDYPQVLEMTIRGMLWAAGKKF
jgi:hypothetical protein